MSKYQQILFSAHYQFQRSINIPGAFRLVNHKEVFQTDFVNRSEKEITTDDSLSMFKIQVESQIKFRPRLMRSKKKISGKRFLIVKKPRKSKKGAIKIGYIFFSEHLAKINRGKIGVGYLINQPVIFIAVFSTSLKQLDIHTIGDPGIDLNLLIDKHEKGDTHFVHLDSIS